MKRYGLVAFLIVICLAMILFTEKGIAKVKGIFSGGQEDKVTATIGCPDCKNCKNCNGVDCTGCESCKDQESCTNCKGCLDGNEKDAINQQADFTIVLDAGHGGADPGKVGVNDAKEKEINLAIVLQMKEILEAKGAKVVLTRASDDPLYSESDRNRKAADLKKRVAIIEEAKPDITVSIHQNSFTDSSSRGAQVFYYGASEDGKKFAEVMQEKMKELISDGNKRMAKANNSYYMLKKTSCPIIIVECGFLSNPAEAGLLVTKEYQKRMAEAVCEGILAYMGESGEMKN